MSLLEVLYPDKFYRLSHSQVLGSLLHQLGIERKSFGDILVGQGEIHIYVDERFSSYFKENLKIELTGQNMASRTEEYSFKDGVFSVDISGVKHDLLFKR